MYATCIDTCSTLIYINYIHIQVRGGGGGGGGPDPPDPPPCVRPCSYVTRLRTVQYLLFLTSSSQRDSVTTTSLVGHICMPFLNFVYGGLFFCSQPPF